MPTKAELFKELDRLQQRVEDLESRQDGSTRRDQDQRQAQDGTLLRSVVDNYPCFISLKNLDGRFLLVNESYAKASGISVEDAVGKSADDLEPPAYMKTIKEYDRKTLESGQAVMYERVLASQSGEQMTRAVTKFPIYNADENLMGVGTIGVNITDMKRVEKALRESEARFRDFAESASDWMWETDAEGRFTLATEGFFEASGLRREDLIGRTRQEFIEHYYKIPISSQDESRIANLNVFDQQEAFQDVLFEFRRTDGSTLYFVTNGKPILDENGKFQGFRGTGNDITERKLSENALKESEARFRDFAESATDWIWETDAEGRYIFVSEAFCEASKFRPEDFIGKTRNEFYEQDHGAVVTSEGKDKEAHLNAFDRHEPFRNVRAEVLLRDGSTLHSETSGKPVFDESGEFRGYRGAAVNVTDLRQAEKALREGEAHLRLVMDSLPAMIVHVDANGRYAMVNKTCCEWFNRPEEEIIGKRFQDIHGESNYDKFQPGIDKILAGELATWDTDFTYPDGVTRNIRNINVPSFDGEGNVDGWFAIVHDVSERKQMEEELRESEARLEEIFAIAPEAVITIGGNMNIQLFNKGAERIFGYRAEEVVGQGFEILMPERLRQGHTAHVEGFDRSTKTYRLMDDPALQSDDPR